MRLTLNPNENTNIASLRLSEGVLPVGRNVEPFSSYPPSLTERLSRRHARVFLKGGKFFVSDTGSSNGTLVNDEPVQAEAVSLQQGDRINFGGELEFTADISMEDMETPTSVGSARLILEPTRPDSGLNRLVVTRFPLLIGKYSDPLARDAAASPDELKYLSRRHAHLYSRDGQVYVEDLGSTNGTYVSSERLGDEPKPLNDGDIVAFGGDFFEYRVILDERDTTADHTLVSEPLDADRTRIMSAKEPDSNRVETSEHTAASSTDRAGDATDTDSGSEYTSESSVDADAGIAREEDVHEVGRTTFVSSPTSFLDIFCADDEPNAADQRAKVNPSADADRKNAGTTGRKAGGIAAALAVLAVAVTAVIMLLPDAKEQELRELIKSGQVEEAARLGNRWMANEPDAKSLQPLATKAFLQHVVPDWQRLIEDDSFALANKHLSQAEPLVAHNDEAAELLNVLRWVTNLEALVQARGGPDAKIRIYEDERDIRAIVDAWSSDEAENRRLLDLIPVHVPEFSSLKRLAYSHVRGFLTSGALYLEAIDDLSDKIAAGLRQTTELSSAQRVATLDALSERINDFSTKYPRIVGLDKLRHDLNEYRAFNRLVDDRDLSGALQHIADKPPRTPPFKRHRSYVLDAILPSKDYLEAYGAAQRAWNSGDLAGAMEILHRLKADDWNAVAAEQLTHYQQIARQFETLEDNRGGKDYRTRLLAFFQQLDEEDQFFKDRLSDEFSAARAEIVESADESFQEALSYWQDYRNQGGIDGGMRVSRSVSTSYKGQAELLGDALQRSIDAERAYSSVGEVPGPDRIELQNEIRQEVVRQRKWLEDVEQIVGPTIIQKKLALLPETIESGESQ